MSVRLWFLRSWEQNTVATRFFHQHGGQLRLVSCADCFSSWYNTWFEAKSLQNFLHLTHKNTLLMLQCNTSKIGCLPKMDWTFHLQLEHSKEEHLHYVMWHSLLVCFHPRLALHLLQVYPYLNLSLQKFFSLLFVWEVSQKGHRNVSRDRGFLNLERFVQCVFNLK